MKVALCISGLLRTFEKNFSNLNTFFLKQYQPDVFIHTWSEIDRGIKINNFKNKIDSVFHPKRLLIEDPKKFEYSENIKKNNTGNYDINGVFSMYYSINKSFNLIDNYYDTIIRLRGDCLIKNTWSLLPTGDAIILPTYGNFSGYNDQIAYGTQDKMMIYSECFNKIESYCNNNINFCPEFLLKHHLDFNNIRIEKQEIDYDIIWYNGQIHNMKQKEIDFGFV